MVTSRKCVELNCYDWSFWRCRLFVMYVLFNVCFNVLILALSLLSMEVLSDIRRHDNSAWQLSIPGKCAWRSFIGAGLVSHAAKTAQLSVLSSSAQWYNKLNQCLLASVDILQRKRDGVRGIMSCIYRHAPFGKNIDRAKHEGERARSSVIEVESRDWTTNIVNVCVL